MTHCPTLRAVVLLVLWSGLAAAPATQAQTQLDWAVCADEGQICQVNGDAIVRFGIDGRYLFRMTRSQQPCDVQAFGSDPAPGRRKQCEVSVNWRGDNRYRGWRDPAQAGVGGNWRHCAVEGESCAVTGKARVRFGVDGSYATRDVTGPVACRTSVFGDPAPGQRKSCEFEDTSGWFLCANEGDVCTFAGTTQVRYGANSNYAEKSATGSIACNNATFGDPLPGVAKQCEYRRVAGMPAIGPAPLTVLPWNVCAREGSPCNFRGAAMLRYGTEGRYAYREASDGLQCSNDAFGTDPAPGARKQCDLLRIGR
jgi:hypothetical protein